MITRLYLATKLLGVILAAGLPAAARAAFILDDFNDPAELRLPDMKFDTVVTLGVGARSARRALDVSTGARPIGVLAVDSASASTLVGQLESIPINGDNQLVDLSFRYDFDFFDATQGGAYDGVLLDFSELRLGSVAALVDAFAGDHVSQRYQGFGGVLADSATPFTVALPFAAFTAGTAQTPADFSRLQSLHFRVVLTIPPNTPQLDFSMAINRVRIGRLPEPATGGMGVFAAWPLLIHGFRRRSGVGRVARQAVDNLLDVPRLD